MLIFVTALIDMIGFGIIIPILPYFAEQYGADASTVGLLTAVFLVVQFLVAPLWGYLSDHFGRRPILLTCIFATSGSYIVFGMATSLELLFVARVLGGMFAGKYATIQAYIADITSPGERAKGMGVFGAAFGLGFILGPLIGGIVGQWGFAAPLFFAAAISVINGVAAIFFLPESRAVRGEAGPEVDRLTGHGTRKLITVISDARIAHPIALAALFNLAFAMLYATFALFAEREFGFRTAKTGMLFAYVGLVGAIIQGGLIGRLVRKMGEAVLVKGGLGLTALGMFQLSISDSVLTLLTGTTLMACGSGLVTPALSGLVSRRTLDAQQGRVLGVLQSAANLGRIGGMVVGGYVFDAISRWSPFWLSGIVLSCASLYSVVTIRQAEAVNHPNLAGGSYE